MTVTDNPTLPDSPVERALVARGWADVDLVERLGPGNSRKHRVAAVQAEVERSASWYESPNTDSVPAGMVTLYESEANVLRYKRVVDYLTPGERVFEVGIGHGFLATMMLREGRLGQYRGVDLSAHCVSQTSMMLANNGLDGKGSVSEKNLYDVRRADVEEIDASLFVCCEVIEHVPDPEEALATLARALPEGTDLLFSVPLIGRLENVWGHTQIFGAARIHEMLVQAGLVAHHVEVLHDTWAVVLASTSTKPSPRAAKVLEASVDVEPKRFMEPSFRAITNHPVTSLERGDSAWTKRVKDASVEPCRVRADSEDSPVKALHVTAAANVVNAGPGKGLSAYAGVAFAVPEGTLGARLEVGVEDPECIEAFRVEWRRAGERIGVWLWKPAEGMPKAKNPTFLINPGRGGQYLKRTPGSHVEGADTVEVFVQAKGNKPIDFKVLRWAWVS